ncbi:MAG: response regulator transcription factor [Actinocatenispora sp.]
MLILVVDDEQALRDALSRTLRFEGYQVELAENGTKALEALRDRPPNLVVLDVLMPNLDGLTTCRALRSAGNLVPVLMLTAADAVGDRVAGLDAGADDYLVKPFALQELLARIRALLRRTGRSDNADDRPDSGRLRYADLVLDLATREVYRGQRMLRLTRTEFAILEVFLHNPLRVLSRSVVFDHVWGYDFGAASNSLDVYIGYLRRKLEASGEPRLLHTVRGVGYVLRDEPL